MSWRGITFPCGIFSWCVEKILLGVFTENMWVGKRQKSDFKASRPFLLWLFMWLRLMTPQLEQISSFWLQTTFIWWECFQNSSIWRNHDWEVSLFSCVNYIELWEKLIIFYGVYFFHYRSNTCSSQKIQKPNRRNEKYHLYSSCPRVNRVSPPVSFHPAPVRKYIQL